MEENKLREIKFHRERLDSLYSSYREAKCEYRNGRTKKVREHGLDNMFSYSKMIQDTLCNPPISEIVLDGNPYQFEDFWKYVESDMPGYLRKIDEVINESVHED